jgi:hypothetical protein
MTVHLFIKPRLKSHASSGWRLGTAERVKIASFITEVKSRRRRIRSFCKSVRIRGSISFRETIKAQLERRPRRDYKRLTITNNKSHQHNLPPLLKINLPSTHKPL